MSKVVPTGYTVSQIALHWLIAAMVIFQLYFGEDMAHANRAAHQGTALTDAQALSINLHVWIGIAILAAVVIRLALRFLYGVPAAPADEPPLTQRLGQASHLLFYVLLFLVPISGLVAYYWLPAAGQIHTLGKPAFILLIALHVLATLWHGVFKRDGVMQRMLRPGRAA